MFYTSSPEQDLPTGEFLGQLKNELSANEYIVQFVSGGPKNYVYITNNGKVIVKIKGFSASITNNTAFTFQNFALFVAKYASCETGSLVPIRKHLTNKEKDKYHEEALLHHDVTPSTPSTHVTDRYISVYNPSKITINNVWRLLSTVEQKMYSCSYDKRMITSDFDTLPFGFCK